MMNRQSSWLPVYDGFDNFKASIMTFLGDFFSVVGVAGHEVGYQAVDGIGYAVGSHDGIVASDLGRAGAV